MARLNGDNGNPDRPSWSETLSNFITDVDLHLFNEGSHLRLYNVLGAHPLQRQGMSATFFAVWAPNAEWVSVVGDFNDWAGTGFALASQGQSGIWAGVVPNVGPGALYKYRIMPRKRDRWIDKADPVGFFHEVPPRTGSVVWDLDYDWHDQEWLARRQPNQNLERPVSIYEVHLGSWMRGEGGQYLSYREVAERLGVYVNRMGFTHVELLPIMEHPFYGSWGYQTTGYFAPTSRYGRPEDFMALIDHLHQRGIGVILDWVPSHFPTDAHGLGQFDGTHLYEHQDPREGFHPDWNSLIFNYGRHEVRSFLLSSALFWLDRYHADGLRVDAVASMLYRDYSRSAGEWIPNERGGRENLEAIQLLQRLNQEVYTHHPGTDTMAEESTAWPAVSRPVYLGGLGFGFKWDMGWMHDTLQYLSRDPVHRRFHHGELTFRMVYAFSENFVLPLSHDEVVHGKGSLLAKMPGDEWQKFAHLRLLYGYLYTMPGKKLLFMGDEWAPWQEWNHDHSLDWHLLDVMPHAGMARWVADLNRLYRSDPALFERDCDPSGFQWVDASDSEQSVISYLRRGRQPHDERLIILNFTPVPRFNYAIGVPRDGHWTELLNSDAGIYGGSGQGNLGGVLSTPLPWHGFPHRLTLTLPPLGALVLKGPQKATLSRPE